MAGRIQGITVEIGGDTTKLQTALKGVNTEIRNTQSQLKDVDKLLKLDPGNTEQYQICGIECCQCHKECCFQCVQCDAERHQECLRKYLWCGEERI